MLHIALYEPEIPPNTGNIIRLCANAGACLHLIEPLGFSLEEKKLRRAGLDYREWADVRRYPDYPAFLAAMDGHRIWALTTRGGQPHTAAGFSRDDVLLFGPETRGLPARVLEALGHDRQLRIPMQPDSRSLNLSNAAAIVLYEAWRQLGFAGGQ